ncbi:MAG: single-stranded DNA-binding protein [Saprospiraceae bacterium]
MVNKVTLIGNLGADPEVRRLENGVVVAKFNIATTERYKDRNGEQQSQTEWHSVVVWRGLAEVAEKFLKKGKQVYVDGKLTHRKWQDKDGNTRYTTEVVANNFQMLGSRDGGSGYSSNFPSAQDAPAAPQKTNTTTAATTTPTTPAAATPAADAAEDDLPF